jgi:altronate dehydratase
MTQPHSTILDDVQFKLKLIKHFEKVHAKCPTHPETLSQMIFQIEKAVSEIRDIVASNPASTKAVNSLVKESGAGKWFKK